MQLASRRSRHQLVLVAGIVALAIGCSGTVDPGDTTSTAANSGSSTSSTSEGTFVIDFTSSPSGGVSIGGSRNLAVALSTETPRTYSFDETGSTQVRPGAIRTDDFFECSDPEGQEMFVQNLEHLDVADVDVLSLELLEPNPDSPEPDGKMCYGYRRNGIWTWKFDGVPWSYDAVRHVYKVSIAVHQDGIDAIKVMPNSSGTRFLTSMKYTTY